MANSQNTTPLPEGTRLSRRRLLLGGAALTIPAVLTARGAPVDADAELIALGAAYRSLWDTFSTHCDREEEQETDEAYDAWDKEQGRLGQAVADLERQIAATPAYTFAGLLVKARIAADNANLARAEQGDIANQLALVRDLERLAGEARS